MRYFCGLIIIRVEWCNRIGTQIIVHHPNGHARLLGCFRLFLKRCTGKLF